ncbi:Uncharacterized protein AC499_4136 [Pseudomonas amygdali pv. lachrymans]|uniref:Uncharacterized protein n=1 Tax=Pseudomonas amygdali pv. lachrymans TaxID=53707 RepID=A0ABR5KKY8_PSEAV|nr:Uncharacterized protein AC499_4136 [Pseudomonas amygdali pv. lachrymans]RMV57088.1 hypothetical protein ALP09_200002 [Pseudomonas amygdali pv. lachrymans]
MRGAQAGLAIVEGIDEQLQPFLGTNRTATVVHAVAMHDQQVLRGNTAAAVVQRLARQVHQALGLQAATRAIVQCAGQFQSQLAICDQCTGLAVVQTRGTDVDTLPCAQRSGLIVDGFSDHQFQEPVSHDLASGIIEAQRIQGRVTSAGQLAAAARHLASDVYQQVGIAAQAAAVVIQLIGRQIDTVAGHQATQVGQQLINTHNERFVAEQRACGVVQRRSGQGEAVGAGNFTAAVADCIEIFQQQLARRGNQTAVVVQHAFA